MADYTAILDTQIEPDAPLTTGLAAQWRDNPIAMAEGASGAPRFAYKTAIIEEGDTLTGFLTGYQGVRLWGAVTPSGDPGSAVGVQFSDDGVTWSSSITLNQQASYELWVDFATGNWRRVFFTGSGGGSGSGTLASMPAEPISMRIVAVTGGTCSMMAWANGGEAAS